MTLFKRVFHQTADGETATPILPETPMQLARVTEVELSLDEELPFGDGDEFAPDEDPAESFDAYLDNDSAPDVPAEPLRLEDPVEVHEALFDDAALPDAVSAQDDTPDMPAPETDTTPDIESLLMRRVIEKSPRVETASEDALSEEAAPVRKAPAMTTPLPTPVVENPVSAVVAEPNDDVPDVIPTTPRPGRSARRVRTRMLGFDPGLGDNRDPFEADTPTGGTPAQTYPVGWMVVVEGPGAGNAFALYNGVSTIGRGEDQTITLDFGDTSISREKHAAVAYDNEQNSFFLGHGGKSNIVRLNERPVLSTEDLNHGDTVRIGETTLRFVALCGAGFAWGPQSHDRS